MKSSCLTNRTKEENVASNTYYLISIPTKQAHFVFRPHVLPHPQDISRLEDNAGEKHKAVSPPKWS